MTKFMKRQDQLKLGVVGHPDVLPDALLGVWINTNQNTQGIAKAMLTRQSGDIRLRVFGTCEPELCDWGETKINTFFADGIDSPNAISFTAEYDFGFLHTEVQTNLSKGLLIITSLNTFKDGSSRANYFSREYFYKQPSG